MTITIPKSDSAVSLRPEEKEALVAKHEDVTDDVLVEGYDPLISPALLLSQIPLPAPAKRTVLSARAQAANILAGEDDRLLVVVGPCSIHDPQAGLEYARRLLPLAQRLAPDLLIVMRTYFEKPRTTVGWKGLINDPALDGTFRINDGLATARRFLVDVNTLGLPVAVELLDTITPQYLADCVAWGAIGARTTESQLHREMASGLSFPVGFKNGTDGRLTVAIDAVRAASAPHRFLGVTKTGQAAIARTRGNPRCHIILRGGTDSTNYDASSVHAASQALQNAKVPARLMVDCSHGNSRKIHTNQLEVAQSLGMQVAGGCLAIAGVMVESFLVEGRQDISNDQMVFGQSVTDACLSWEQTVPVLEELATAVKARRNRLATFH